MDDLAGRAMLCMRARPLPVEFTVRGYLAGSGLKDYRATGAVCGHLLPEGLREADRLPQTILTPATKATSGHDENITEDQAASIVGPAHYEEARELALRLYEVGASIALERGIIIADTKFEFGLAEDKVVLIDEVLTPDSSRFWDLNAYLPGRDQPSFDKQFVRDWLETQDWGKLAPGPELPADVVAGTRARYVEAFERITGASFSAYLSHDVIRMTDDPDLPPLEQFAVDAPPPPPPTSPLSGADAS
jgi:phosphoribosylaminoimidazole-succinocarboxamide synthase